MSKWARSLAAEIKRRGVTYGEAAVAIGVSERAVYTWLREGVTPTPICRKAADAWMTGGPSDADTGG